MDIHDAAIGEIHQQGERLLRRIDELKFLLLYVRGLDSKDGVGWESSTRDARALSIICSVAELEALTKTVIQCMHRELNDATICGGELAPCLRQIAAHNAFESLRSLQDSAKVWERRAYVTTLDTSAEYLGLPIATQGPQPPLDGRTLRPEHFFRMWDIYGLPGEAFPSVAWASSLQKLALVRNDIAHGNLPFAAIFQQAGRTVTEIESYVDDLSSFSIHFVSASAEYLEKKLYMKESLSSA